jgi:nuclear pore complex protein Nup205
MYVCPVYVGVLGAARTCLHSLLVVLDRGVGTRTGPRALRDTPRLAELSYQLVYKLCANKETSAPTLRYLRTTHDFLFRQLQHLPFKAEDYGMIYMYI